MPSNISERLRAIVGSRDDVSEFPTETHHVFHTDRRVIKPILIVGSLILAVTFLFTWFNRPHPVISPKVVANGIDLATNSATPTPSSIVVDVEGKVRRPGLVSLPQNSRVADAIQAAGGLLRGVSHANLNLAARVSDGQLILVGVVATVGVSGAGSNTSSGGSGNSAMMVSLNSASASDIEQLPGVGPVLAGRIVSWRQTHGAFRSVDQLQEVPGIGPKVFANLRDFISL